jgi:hypothetical protein
MSSQTSDSSAYRVVVIDIISGLAPEPWYFGNVVSQMRAAEGRWRLKS